MVDLGAAPGGWSQYVVSQIGGKGRVIACDILDMNQLSAWISCKAIFVTKMC